MESIIYYDISYVEGTKKPHFLYPLIGKKYYVANPIFICILDEKGNSFEALFNDFNLNVAWSDIKTRNNILYPLYLRYFQHNSKVVPFNKKTIKHLLKLEGKSSKEISADIKEFLKKPWLSNEVQLVSLDSGVVQSLFAKIFGGEGNIPYVLNKFTYSLRQKYIDKVLEISKKEDISFEKADFKLREMEDFPTDFSLDFSSKSCLNCFKNLNEFIDSLNK